MGLTARLIKGQNSPTHGDQASNLTNISQGMGGGCAAGGGGSTSTYTDPPTRSDRDPWTIILGRKRVNTKPEKRTCSHPKTPLTGPPPVRSPEQSSLLGKHRPGQAATTGKSLARPHPWINRSDQPTTRSDWQSGGRTALQVTQWNLTLKIGCPQHTSVGPRPKGASYAEILGKDRASLGTLGGARRAKRDAERANQKPSWPTPAEATGLSVEKDQQ